MTVFFYNEGYFTPSSTVITVAEFTEFIIKGETIGTDLCCGSGSEIWKKFIRDPDPLYGLL
jgi:hypothetical protein